MPFPPQIGGLKEGEFFVRREMEVSVQGAGVNTNKTGFEIRLGAERGVGQTPIPSSPVAAGDECPLGNRLRFSLTPR